MPVAKEQIRQIISENNISSVTDVYALLRDSFKHLYYNEKVIFVYQTSRTRIAGG